MVKKPSAEGALHASSMGGLGPVRREPSSSVSPASSGRCPRCRRGVDSRWEACRHCGFSLHETRLLAGEHGRIAGGAAASERPSIDLVGKTVAGKYRVVEPLGEGGFGVVYRVAVPFFEDGLCFALKVLHPQLSGNPSDRRRFLREVRMAMEIHHENAIAVRDFGETEDGLLYFTMDFCSGEPLNRVLAREGALPIERALAIVRQILSVMVMAHDQGIIHRDLKPENIFLESDSRGRERVKVGDFGLAKCVDPRRAGEGREITHGGIVGSPRYMSPEQFAGQDLDARSDLYSVGVLLHEMLLGELPEATDGSGGASEGEAVLLERARSRSSLPPALAAVVDRALARSREARFRDAREFLDAIEALRPGDASPAAVAASRSGLSLSWGFAIFLLASVAAVGLCSSLDPALAEKLSRFVFAREAPPQRGQRAGSEPPPPAPTALTVPAAPEREAAAAEAATAEEHEAPAAPAPQAPAPADVGAYAALEVGRRFSYRVRLLDPAPREETIHFTILAEDGEGRFRVRGEPGGHEFFWVLDRQAKRLSLEFLFPSPAGKPEARRRPLLDLNGPPADGVNGDLGELAVLKGERDATVQGMALGSCLQAVDTDLDSGQRTYRYYQRGAGEVAREVFDLSSGQLVYSRVLISGQRSD